MKLIKSPATYAAILSALLTVATPGAFAAIDAFLILDGVDGESMDPQFPRSIEVERFSVTVNNTSPVTGQGGGKPGTGSLMMTKEVDSTTAGFHDNCCNGKHYPQAVLVMRRAGTMEEVARLTFSDLHIISVSTGGSGGEDTLTENVTLNFRTFKADYQPLDPAKPKAEYGWKAKMKGDA